jgi:cation diffusion facilitator CzcD-associated flavoprotein CzcO
MVAPSPNVNASQLQSGSLRHDVDVVIVGAGFSGISTLYRTRKLGLKAIILEGGSNYGGVWYHNRYPGARVDSEWPYYQLNIPEVYESWSFSERFPGHEELRRYMAHVEKILDLHRDTVFNALVNDCSWDEKASRWTVRTQQGHVATGKYLLLCTGLLHRLHYPDFPGLDKFRGEIHHSGVWREDINTKGRKVALVGAGATAVQITQEVAKDAKELTIFMRRPSYCLPMRQRPLNPMEQVGFRAYYDTLLRSGRKTLGGFPMRRPDKPLHADPDAEKALERVWAAGGLQAMNAYPDVYYNKASNDKAYEFWARKTRSRMRPGRKCDLMIPKPGKEPYRYGTKRMPLEQDYYEMLDQDHVDIVAMNEKRIKTFTSTGLEYEDGDKLEFDMLILATGFDSFSGRYVLRHLSPECPIIVT